MSNIGKILWVVAIIFMGLTATMNLLGGTGTVCAAFLFMTTTNNKGGNDVE